MFRRNVRGRWGLARIAARRPGGKGRTVLVLNLMLIGVAVALDPLPLTAFLVVLPSKRGVRNGAAFLFGWLVSLAVVVTATVLATGNNPPKPDTAPSYGALAVRTAIGVVLVAAAIRQWRKTRRPKPPKKPPKWQQHVDRMSPWFALGLAPALQPWVMIGAGVATIVEAKASSWESYLALARFRTWMDTHTDQLIIVGSLVLGFWLIGKSIYLVVT